jgi:hypothetical protein
MQPLIANAQEAALLMGVEAGQPPCRVLAIEEYNDLMRSPAWGSTPDLTGA